MMREFVDYSMHLLTTWWSRIEYLRLSQSIQIRPLHMTLVSWHGYRGWFHEMMTCGL